MSKKNLLIIGLLLTGLVYGQDDRSYSFTLEEAINFALDSSYTAINSRREIAKALKQKWETTATGLPQLDAAIGYQNNIKQPVVLIPGEIAGDEAGSFVPVVFGTRQNANAVATLNQLIFDGSYLVGLQAARAFLDYSQNANERTRLEIRKGVVNAYCSVLLAREIIDIFSKNTENLQTNLDETRAVYKNGLAEEEDVEQLEITLLELRTQLDNAHRSEEIAEQMFKVALGIEIGIPVILTENLDDLAELNINLAFMEDSLEVEKNVDYKIAFNLTEQRSLELKLEKSRYLPTLNAFLNYGTQANANDFAFFDSDLRWFQSSLLGVNLNIPILSSGLRNARTQQAQIALDQAETQLEQTIQEIKLQHEMALSNYHFMVDKYQNSKKYLALSQRIERKNQIKFAEGIASSFELRQAQTQLYTAQQEYFQSMLNLINAKTDLETVLNTPRLREN